MGEGVEKNWVKAIEYYSRSAENGFDYARSRLEKICSHLDKMEEEPPDSNGGDDGIEKMLDLKKCMQGYFFNPFKTHYYYDDEKADKEAFNNCVEEAADIIKKTKGTKLICFTGDGSADKMSFVGQSSKVLNTHHFDIDFSKLTENGVKNYFAEKLDLFTGGDIAAGELVSEKGNVGFDKGIVAGISGETASVRSTAKLSITDSIVEKFVKEGFGVIWINSVRTDDIESIFVAVKEIRDICNYVTRRKKVVTIYVEIDRSANKKFLADIKGKMANLIECSREFCIINLTRSKSSLMLHDAGIGV
jgi:hypothetical protein